VERRRRDVERVVRPDGGARREALNVEARVVFSS
jgi:hypothetical protein